MTDFELNKAIAEFVYPDAYEIKKVFGTSKVNIFSSPVTFPAITIDYCNNWSDLMPLVVEHLSAFWKSGDESTPSDVPNHWNACYGNTLSPMVDWNLNPQRALAECLLKVLQGASQ